MAKQALAGLKVVEYGNYISAPFCAKLLADLGAEVIKIEDPSGDESRRYGPFPDDIPDAEKSGLFIYLNANKSGITLNLATPTGRDLLHGLLGETDIFVHNVPRKKAEELGLAYEKLGPVNPRLIVASITPFGLTGPYRDYKAYDINLSAAGGLSIGIGFPDRKPLALPVSFCAYQCGLATTIAVLCALFGRDVIGQGQAIDVAEADVMAVIYGGYYLPTFLYQGIPGKRRGRHSGLWGRYPQATFDCKDGFVTANAPQVAMWMRLLEAMGNPEWANLPRYRDRRAMTSEYPDEVDELWRPWRMAHTRDELVQIFTEKHVPSGAVYNIDEVVNHPHLRARDYFLEVGHPRVGPVEFPGPPYRLSETPWRVERSAPLLGQHNESIICGRLGFSREDLASLRRTGVI